MLHVTNGQATVEGFRSGNVPGTYLAWDDPLHDGPVVAAPSLEALSRSRARALAAFGWGSLEALDKEFAERDWALARFRDHDETVLWFEHDLYDQLQLIQLLEWFSRRDLSGVRLSIIQIGEYPTAGSEASPPDARPDATRPFHGLGELDGRQLAALLPTRVPVTSEHLEIGGEAWLAFCAPDPMPLVDLANTVLPAMPYLAPALRRLLEEYPSAANGLSRLEQQLLVSAALGAHQRQAFYLQSQEFETCPWGDSSVYLRLDGLAAGPNPALRRSSGDEFALTDHGRRLLSGADDWVVTSGGLDRWIGGVHLVGATVRWRWIEESRTLATRAPDQARR